MAAQSEPVNSDFDTVVIGGGIVGLCATWFLAEDGEAVLCLDDGRNAGSVANAGSLHGQLQSRTDRMFPHRVADFEKTLSIYPRAIDYWEETAQRLDEDVELKIEGGLMIAENAEQMQALAVKSKRERKHGVETSLVGRQELSRMAPYLNADVYGATYCRKEGKVNPLLANAAIRSQALECGGTIRCSTHVDRIEQTRNGFVIFSNAGRYETGRVVIAAGVGSGALASTLGVYLPTAAEALHMNITEVAVPFMQHLLQHAELPLSMKQLKNGQLVIGGGWPARSAPEPCAPAAVLNSLIGNLELAQHIVPGIRDLRVIRTWTGINTMLDLVSVLGEIESLPGVFVAVPGDAGYTLGPYCARLVVERMSGRETDYPLSHLSLARFSKSDDTAAVIRS